MPAKLERCVLHLVGSDKFKPGMSHEKRKSSAYAICTASLQKSGDMSEAELLVEADRMVAMSDQSFFVSSCLSDIPVMAAPGSDQFVRREIDVLREGVFDNPQFGELVFDEPKMDAFISNFKSGVLGRDVVIKVEHAKDGGTGEAAAWYRDFYKAKRQFSDGRELMVLRATVDFTPLGIQKVGSGQYKYFSAEYKDHYTDKETGADYGPTITGGALTNEPFIPGLMPIMLSDEPKNGVKIFNEVQTETMEGGPMKDLLEKLQKELSDLKAQFTAMTEADQKAEAGKALADKITGFETTVKELSDAVAVAEKANTEGSDRTKVLDAELTKAKTELSEANALIRAMTKDVEVLKTDNEKTKAVAMSERIKNYKTQLRDQGIWPATIEVVEKVLLADGLKGQSVVTLSEPDKDGKPVSRSLDIMGTVDMIIASIPKESRIDLSDVTHTKLPAGSGDAVITLEMRKLATERAFKAGKK